MNLLFRNMGKKNKKSISLEDNRLVIDDRYLVYDQDINICIGEFMVNMLHNMPSIDYRVFPLYRNMGYGKEILRKLSNLIVLNNYEKIYLLIDDDNFASLRVADKCGYELDSEYTSLRRDNDMELHALTLKLDCKKRRR